MAARDGIFGRILVEVQSRAYADEDGVRGRLAGKGASRDGGSVRNRLLQGLARSGGFSRKASAGAAAGRGPKPELRLNTRQRVIVKAHIAKHGVRGFGGGGGGGLRAHVAYLGREGRDGPERGEFYDRDGDGLDAKAHVRDWGEDRHHFRFIISPEHGDKLDDLRGYVRDLMDEVASDLKEPDLDWIGVNHFDTDQPHAHVLVRGSRADGRVLIIPKDYMARGFRVRAEERATRELGDVSRDQAEERLRKEVTADRVTGLDRYLEKSVCFDGRVPADLIDDRHTYGALLRGRLQHLEGLGLATKDGRDWRVAEGFTQSLESLSREQDVLRTLHARMAKTRAPVALVRDGLAAGRVVEAGRDGLVLQDRDGVERVFLGSADGVAKGALVIAEAGERALGVFDLGDPRKDFDAERLTAIDQLLEWRAGDRAGGISPALFDATTEGLIESRAAFLREAGLALEGENGTALTNDGWAQLREADIRLSIEEQLGRDDAYQTEALSAREGRYLGTVKTQSGLFAVAERGAGLVYGAVSEVPQIAVGQAIAMDPSKDLIQVLDHGLNRGLGLDI